MKITDILEGVAVGLDATSTALKSSSAIESEVAAGAAIVVRTLASLLTDRTPEECIAILVKIRDTGAVAITQSELDAQIATAIRKASQG